MIARLLVLAAALAAILPRAGSAEDPGAPPAPAPAEKTPEPCRAPTGSVDPPTCSPVGTLDPSQPRRERDAAREEPLPGWVGWADAGHGTVEEGLDRMLQRVDGFFGDPTHIQFDPPAFRARLRGGVRFGQDDTGPDFSVLADARLPSLDRLLSRARLFIRGGYDEDVVQSGTEQDLVPRRFSPSVGTSRGALEMRFDLFREQQSIIDFGGGARFALPPTPYLRLRGAHARQLALGIVGHVNQTGFWERGVGFGESTRIDMERALAPRTIARAWTIGTLHERSRGFEWGAELGLAQGLGAKTGLYAAGALEGATRPQSQVDRYRVFTRIRRDVHRAWVFAEVEPEVAWPLELDGRRPRVLAATFRLELQFASVTR